MRNKILKMIIPRIFLAVMNAGLLVFLPAGTLKYWNGWVFLGSLFVPLILVMVYLMKRDPELAEKRMRTKERDRSQKVYQVLSALASFIIYVIPGLDFRFQWSDVPVWLVIMATIGLMTGNFLLFLVMRQNSYASRVIEIQEGQQIMDKGLYAVVRHPMYMAALIIFGFSPLVLGSYYALIPMALFMPFLLVFRLLHEEKLLKRELEGYQEYTKKTRYRLIPYVW